MRIDFEYLGVRGAWVAPTGKHPTLAQFMISQFVSSSPASGSVLTARNLDPTSDSMSPSLSAPPLLTLCLYLSLSLKNKHLEKERIIKRRARASAIWWEAGAPQQRILGLRGILNTDVTAAGELRTGKRRSRGANYG